MCVCVCVCVWCSTKLQLKVLVRLYLCMVFHFIQDISELATSIYIPRGVNVKSLSTSSEWPFRPSKMFKVKMIALRL